MIKHFKIEITGTTPLLCNKFTDAAALAATNSERGAVTLAERTPMEECETRLYYDVDDNTIIPGSNLFSCLIEGGKFFKIGRSKVTTQQTSMVSACLMMGTFAIPIKSKEGWTVDTRPIRNPVTKGKVNRHRPIFNDWALTFECELDSSLISPKMFREIVDAAGKRIGLGDFRPACKGMYGKFKVTKWENGA